MKVNAHRFILRFGSLEHVGSIPVSRDDILKGVKGELGGLQLPESAWERQNEYEVGNTSIRFENYGEASRQLPYGVRFDPETGELEVDGLSTSIDLTGNRTNTEVSISWAPNSKGPHDQAYMFITATDANGTKTYSVGPYSLNGLERMDGFGMKEVEK